MAEFTERQKQALEVLSGERGHQSKRQRAVLIEDLEGILRAPARLQSTVAAGAAPTQAEFDALRTDVEALRQALAQVATALKGKL